MILTFDGSIKVDKSISSRLLQEIADKMNFGLAARFEPAGTKPWSVKNRELTLLTGEYRDDDIEASLDTLSEYLKEHNAIADGSVNYYGDYRGEYEFDKSQEYEENEIDDSDFEDEWNQCSSY